MVFPVTIAVLSRSFAALVAVLALLLGAGKLTAQDAPAYLLFGGENNEVFAGCLNCGRYNEYSVCSRYGDYGARYSETSIWSRFGEFGGRYANYSPWSRYGEGLVVVDPDGNYYGRFRQSRIGQSNLDIVQALIEAWEYFDGDRMEIRDWFCGF